MKIPQTRNVLAQIERELEGFEYISDDRNDVSLSLLDISIDHSKSIVILCENGIFSSAYALARPMFECFVRGVWVQYCASEEKLEEIRKNDTFPRQLGVMVDAIEKTTAWPKGLSNIKNQLLKNMHSYTHGGIQLTARRFSGNNLIHIPEKEEVNALLRMVSIISFLAFVEIVKIAGISIKDHFIEKLQLEIESKILIINSL